MSRSFLSLLFLLCLNTIDARDLALRGTESSYTNTTESNSGSFDFAASGSASTTPMITPSSSTAAFTKCRSYIAACSLGAPPASISWNWPDVRFTNVTVATIVYKVNNETNSTSTRTDYHTDTVAEQNKGPTRTVNNDADMWNSLLTTTGVSMSDNVPVLDFTATVYTDVNAYITITTKLPSPTNYYNAGWLYEIGDMRPGSTNSVLGTSAASFCTWASQTLALMPSATLSGYDNPYYSPLKISDWSSMVMTTMTDKCTSYAVGACCGPPTAIQLVNALTDTTTLYDVVVHSPIAKLGPTGSKSSKTSSIITGVDTPSTSDKFKSATPALTPVVIASHTVTPGAAPVTISGTKYSLAASGSTLMVDGSNSLILASTVSGKSGIGSMIWSGLGGTVTGSAVSATYTGKGVRLQGTGIATAWWLFVSTPLALLAAY